MYLKSRKIIKFSLREQQLQSRKKNKQFTSVHEVLPVPWFGCCGILDGLSLR